LSQTKILTFNSVGINNSPILLDAEINVKALGIDVSTEYECELIEKCTNTKIAMNDKEISNIVEVNDNFNQTVEQINTRIIETQTYYETIEKSC
jgi:hypothetical protein